jgi:hypothetical protein
MDKAELKAAIDRVEKWSSKLMRISATSLKSDVEVIIAAARSTIEPVEFNGHNQDAEPFGLNLPTFHFKSASEPFAEGEPLFVPLMTGQISVGRLGATVPEGSSPDYALTAALDMAERRVLRIEHALKVSGIDVEILGLGE